MASLHKILTISKDIGVLCSRMMSLQTGSIVNQSSHIMRSKYPQLVARSFQPIASFHMSSPRQDLMQFFDDKKNWGQSEVKSGRSWTLDELRIKSNSDLHKLWFVLLKEKNMLLTMEHECKEKVELFPSPERLDKVNLSMEHLETVVRERNKAYHMLETGIDGERPGRMVNNQLGMKFFYREREHLIPKAFNSKWRERHVFRFEGAAVSKFRRLLKEKIYNGKRRLKNRERNEVMHLLRRNPNLNKDLLSQKYPSVDIKKLVREDKIRGHYVPQ